ncbi:MAG: hypothetical protein WDA75_19930 [Candidatus Latescibacterota bacterium]|jgi:hypothetical protein
MLASNPGAMSPTHRSHPPVDLDESLADADLALEGLGEVLDQIIADEEPAEVSLRAPEDLIFGQVFFPKQLATEALRSFGRQLRVVPVAMRSLQLQSVEPGPGDLGMLLRVQHRAGNRLDPTFFVLPREGITCLAATLGVTVRQVLAQLFGPGQTSLEKTLGLYSGLVPSASRLYLARDGGSPVPVVCLTYRLEVDDAPAIELVQYAPMQLLNQMTELLARESTTLVASPRNLMLQFLRLSTLLGAVALDDPRRAGDWLGPLLGYDAIPPFRPGEEMPDPYDLNTWMGFTDAQLAQLAIQPEVRKLGIRRLACALALANNRLRDKLERTLPSHTWAALCAQARQVWAPEEVWAAQREVVFTVFALALRKGYGPTDTLRRQMHWMLRYFSAEWRVLGLAVTRQRRQYLPTLASFESMMALTDADLRLVLADPEIRRRGAWLLGYMLIQSPARVRARFLRHLAPEQQRKARWVLLKLREGYDVSRTEMAQDTFVVTAYFLALRGELHPPASIQRQIDDCLATLDQELRESSMAILEDDTFDRQVAELSPLDRRLLRKLVEPDTFLWALQNARPETVSLLTADITREGQAAFRAEQDQARRRLKDEDLRRGKVTNARLLVIDASRLLLKVRRHGVRVWDDQPRVPGVRRG